MTEPFLLHPPVAPSLPILANLPHSGERVPPAIAQMLKPPYQQYLPYHDWHLDKLYDFLPGMGVTMLQAIYSRYVVDLNRSLQPPHFGSFWHSVVAEKTPHEVPIYDVLPSQGQIQERIDAYYQPYHDQLQNLLDRLISQFGKVYLLDLHSFFGLITDDVCLGNANGASCSEPLIAAVEQAFSRQGYGVVRNKVFSGGHITRHYGQQPQVEALQIEVRYPLYLNTEELELGQAPNWKTPHFEQAKRVMERVFKEILSAIAS